MHCPLAACIYPLRRFACTIAPSFNSATQRASISPGSPKKLAIDIESVGPCMGTGLVLQTLGDGRTPFITQCSVPICLLHHDREPTMQSASLPRRNAAYEVVGCLGSPPPLHLPVRPVHSQDLEQWRSSPRTQRKPRASVSVCMFVRTSGHTLRGPQFISQSA